MIFSSPYFLFLYFPIVLVLYYISPLRWRNPVLLIVNLIFYGWGEPVYVLIMFLSIAIDYSHGRIVTRCKAKGNDRGAPNGRGLLGDLQPAAAGLLQVL